MSINPDLRIHDCQEQPPLRSAPYDRWLTPDGETTAEFHRSGKDYLLRFPDQADFLIASDCHAVACTPVPAMAEDALRSLFANSVCPAIANHRGSLHLHGSAVLMDGRAVAFMGLSRSGKTTLAGAFASAGYPFLSEDVLALEKREDGFMVRPQRPVLRLFGDSAAYLLKRSQGGQTASAHPEGEKRELAASDAMPSADIAGQLAALCILGPGEAEAATLTRMDKAAALAQMMQHGFILDVEDRPRLHDHFGRLAELASVVPCFMLDYPREFSELPQVIRAVRARLKDV